MQHIISNRIALGKAGNLVNCYQTNDMLVLVRENTLDLSLPVPRICVSSRFN